MRDLSEVEDMRNEAGESVGRCYAKGVEGFMVARSAAVGSAGGVGGDVTGLRTANQNQIMS